MHLSRGRWVLTIDQTASPPAAIAAESCYAAVVSAVVSAVGGRDAATVYRRSSRPKATATHHTHVPPLPISAVN